MSFITKETVYRLIHDVKELKNHPLSSNGIYYSHHPDNILEGNALIIGPKDTIYEGGYFFFKFNFPKNYPHSPPVVQFKAVNSKYRVRIHPNLYFIGKVCISILNTWSGDLWTGCQSISSVLLTICSLLTNDPMYHEPGVTKNHKDFSNYNKVIEYEAINTNIVDVLDNDLIKNEFPNLYDIAKSHFLENYNSIYNKVKNNTTKPMSLKINLYKFTSSINYETLLKKLEQLKNKLNK